MADITLYPHNQTAYDNLNTALRYTKHTAVIQPTGTGKSFIALKYINDHKGEKVVYLSPSSYIFDQLEVHAEGSDILANTELITYQKLIYCSIEEIRELMAKHIITDEFHRCGADEWGRAVRQLLAEHPAANVIGFSATPIRYLDKAGVRDMTEELFHGSVANYYSLRQAMEDGILPHPKYVLADIYMADKIYEREQRLESIDNVERRAEQEAILQEMRRYLSDAQGIDQIFKDHLPSTHAKLIVFCQNLEHIDQAKEDMEKWLTDIASVRCYTCRSDEDSSDAELDAFIADADQTYIRLLFAVNMLNEGLHVKDVDGVVMLRPTSSPTVYLQQLGRCLSSSPVEKAPVIFDLVNNYESVKTIDTGEKFVNIEFEMQKDHKESVKPLLNIVAIGKIKNLNLLIEKLDNIWTKEGMWDHSYNKLFCYFNENGRLPTKHLHYQGVNIYAFLQNNRAAYYKGVLLAARQEKLEHLGVIFCKPTVPVKQEEYIEAATIFAEKYGSLSYIDSPLCESFSSQNKVTLSLLKKWVQNQRTRRKKHLLKQDVIDILDSLGMEWNDKIYRGFIEMCNYYEKYKKENPELNYIKQDYICPNGRSLSRWAIQQRRRSKDGQISEDEKKMLSSVGFDWCPLASNHKQLHPDKLWSLDDIWEFNYNLLVSYISEYGMLPQTYTIYQNTRLGYWLNNNKKAYRKGTISPERLKKLEALSSFYEELPDELTTSGKTIKESLDKNNIDGQLYVDALAEFITLYGSMAALNMSNAQDFISEKDVTVEDLRKWVSKQRAYYKKDIISTSRKELLDAIGFVWESPHKDSWYEMYEYMKQYFKENPTAVSIPQNYKCPNGKSLMSWAKTQRRRKKEGLITHEEEDLLNTIAFDWNPSRKASIEKTSWAPRREQAINLCKEYFRLHGNLDVPNNYKDSKTGFNLGKWLSKKRSDYRNGVLQNDMIHELESLGVRWQINYQQDRWNRAFLEAEKYYKEHGHLRVPKDYIKTKDLNLYHWIIQQRSNMKKGLLDEKKIMALNSLGIRQLK